MHWEKFKQLCEYIARMIDRQSLTRLNILLVLPICRYSGCSKGSRNLEIVYEWELYSVPLCFPCSSSYNLLVSLPDRSSRFDPQAKDLFG